MYGDSYGSTKGKWTVIIPPMDRPVIKLRILWRESPGNAIYDAKTQSARAIHNFEVAKFTLKECPEGDFSKQGPALQGQGSPDWEGNDVYDFLQAIVNEAAKIGIYATGTKDATKELTAVRGHLEDMRALVLHGAGIQTSVGQNGRRET